MEDPAAGTGEQGQGDATADMGQEQGKDAPAVEQEEQEESMDTAEAPGAGLVEEAIAGGLAFCQACLFLLNCSMLQRILCSAFTALENL